MVACRVHLIHHSAPGKARKSRMSKRFRSIEYVYLLENNYSLDTVV